MWNAARRAVFGLSLLLLAAAGVAERASAATIVRTYTVTGSNFSLVFGTGNPFPTTPYTFQFTVNFDNSQNYSLQSSGLTMLQDPLAMADVRFGYNALTDALRIGSGATSFGCTNSVNEVCLLINAASSAAPSFASMVLFIDQPGNPFNTSLYVAQTRTLTFVDAISPVPEPGSWAVLILGFGMIGAGLRARSARRFAAHAALT